MDDQVQTRDYFNRVATSYLDRYYSSDSGHYPNLQIRADIVNQALADFVKPEGRVLDAGCGAGNLTVELARRGYHAHGIDLAPNMVEVASSSASTLSEDQKARFEIQQGSIEALPYPDAFFDATVASGVFEYLQVDDPALAELRRVLKASGIALISYRNRTFNAYSANAYTLKETEAGELKNLLEATTDEIRKDIKSINHNVQYFCQELAKASERLAERSTAAGNEAPEMESSFKEQSDQFWEKTMMRRQHSVTEVKAAAEKAGFDLEKVFFFHFHPFPPFVRDIMPEAYDAIGLALEAFRETRLGMIFASGFVAMLRAKED